MTTKTNLKNGPKRITKTELNQLAKSQYGEDAHCEHMKSGQRGWYLYHGSEPIFLGVNAIDAFNTLTETSPSSQADIEKQTLPSTTPTQVETVPDSDEPSDILPSTSIQEESAQNAKPSEITTELPKEELDRSPISAEEMLEILMEKFPNTFFKSAEKIRPVQKYIHKKIRRALNNEYTKEEISSALALYTQNIDYCRKLIEGGERIDLAGNSCGEISSQHIEDAKARIEGNRSMRPAKIKKSKIAKTSSQVFPQPEQLICGKIEVNVKIDELPADAKTVKNGWQEFTIDTNGQMVKITIRPKTWNKLQKAAHEYPFWIASIRGKMGPRMKGGFELEQPVIQIFEKNNQESAIE